ncbi:MAG TPA: Calx-beta domain-containing protein [Ohtaekwangia sp.]|nr:Calx-beta domain-containing protein [Ohtaekwangia sp.]
MKKFTRFSYLCAAAVTVLGVGFTSCSKDDDDPKSQEKAKLSFALAELTVNEADGTFEVEIILDKAASEDFVVEYEIDGSAQDDATASDETPPSDYEFVGDRGEVEIPAGETSAVIEIRLFPDFLVENDETIELSIVDVDSDEVEITRDDEMEIIVGQEQDGILVALEWDDELYTDVDLDLFIRVAALGDDVAAQGVAWGSVTESTQSGEVLFIPASINNALFGMSYTYYSGTADPLNFTATFIDVVDGEFEAEDERESFDGTYTLDNINQWTNASSTKVSQTFEIVAGEFTNFSDIVAPGTGSRMPTSGKVSTHLRKGNSPSVGLKEIELMFERKR